MNWKRLRLREVDEKQFLKLQKDRYMVRECNSTKGEIIEPLNFSADEFHEELAKDDIVSRLSFNQEGVWKRLYLPLDGLHDFVDAAFEQKNGLYIHFPAQYGLQHEVRFKKIDNRIVSVFLVVPRNAVEQYSWEGEKPAKTEVKALLRREYQIFPIAVGDRTRAFEDAIEQIIDSDARYVSFPVSLRKGGIQLITYLVGDARDRLVLEEIADAAHERNILYVHTQPIESHPNKMVILQAMDGKIVHRELTRAELYERVLKEAQSINTASVPQQQHQSPHLHPVQSQPLSSSPATPQYAQHQ